MGDLEPGANGEIWLGEPMLHDLSEGRSVGFHLEDWKFRQFVGGGIFTKRLHHFLLIVEVGFVVKSLAFELGGKDVLDFICNRGGDSSWGRFITGNDGRQ